MTTVNVETKYNIGDKVYYYRSMTGIFSSTIDAIYIDLTENTTNIRYHLSSGSLLDEDEIRLSINELKDKLIADERYELQHQIDKIKNLTLQDGTK